MEIQHQADLAEGVGEFEKRDAFRRELRDLHGQIQGDRCGAYAAFRAGYYD
jgi:hypothetical protein